MKKFFLFVYFASIAAFLGYSQSLKLYDTDHNPLPNNTTIVSYGAPSADEIVTYAYVKNNSSSAIPVKVKKVERKVLPTTYNVFCWGLCFAPSVYVSPDPLIIEAGATDTTNFSGHYTPNGEVGISTIRYVFFNDNNVNDSVCFNVDYSTFAEGIKDFAQNSVKIYPNPANQQATITYFLEQNSDARIVVRNILGASVFDQTLISNQGNLTLNTSIFNNGVYFYSLIVDGTTKVTQKLIINH